jgi:flagellar hook-associated protein 3 FlgL
MVSLLNSQADGKYIFAGSDVNNPPVINAQTYLTNIGTAINSYVGATAGDGINAAYVVESNNNQYSTALNAAEPSALSVRVDTGQDIAYGIRANVQQTVTAAPAAPAMPSQLPYFREILMDVASIAKLSYNSPSPANLQAYNDVIDTISSRLNTAASDLNDQIGILGNTSKHIDTITTRHDDMTTYLNTRIDDIENVDPAKTISELQQAQAQLQASYKVTASLSQISLVNYM